MAVVWCYTYTVPSQSKMAHGIHCCSMNRRKPEKLQTQAPKLLKLAVSGATQLLSLLSPPHKHRLDELNGEGGNIELSVSDVDDVLTIIKDDYEREYFVTGLFTSAIYAEDCTFEDPTIKFRGRDLYSRNLKLLVPFFDNPSIKLEKIEKNQEEIHMEMEEMHMEIGLLCSDMNHRMNIIEGSFAQSFTAVLQIGDTGTDLVGWLARAYPFFSN